jgi:hypothetical protein
MKTKNNQSPHFNIIIGDSSKSISMMAESQQTRSQEKLMHSQTLRAINSTILLFDTDKQVFSSMWVTGIMLLSDICKY